MTLRMLLLLFLVIVGTSPASATDTAPSIEVWKSATCSCCGAWVKHLEANGFSVKVNAADAGALAELKREAGIGDELASCHTAKIDGYVRRPRAGHRHQTLDRQRPEAPSASPSRECRQARLEWSRARTLSPMMFC